MSGSMAQAFAHNFLGHSPRWYKASILAFLILNPLVLLTAGPVAAGWRRATPGPTCCVSPPPVSPARSVARVRRKLC